MESETLDTSSISSSTKSSSWPIVRGSLDDAVTFESSISSADSESDHTFDVRRKPPLILRRPSPDSGPCEITIDLAHQHEVRQVYVRSTARVYEIYYAADEKGGNEYLCTVRCGLASQNDEPMQLSDAIGSMPAGSNRRREEGHSGTENGSSINEDGWVDVDPSGFDDGDRPLSNKHESCSEKGNKDHFEATAEISDVDPVMSVTLRLLSIQSGDYVYIDEVYIYADPVISEYTDASSKMPESASGSALMSMLVPTLLQLSKSRTNQMQQRSDSAATEKRKSLDAEHKSTSAAIISGVCQSERIPSSEIHSASVHMSQPEVLLQTLDRENRPYSTGGENRFSCSHIERTLDELVSRISRIEHFCLRFEENMLKPISSMEARLEKVEKQLESYFKTPQSCRTGCCRISAPEFSCHDSESNSTWINGSDCHESTKSDTVKNDDCCHEEISVPPSESSSSANAVQNSDMPDLVKNDDCCPEVVSVPPLEASSFANGVQPSDVPLSTNVSQLHPSLVVTAPDFSSIDDEEENDMIEAAKDSPKGSLKKPLSVDDALASALAGFLASALTDPSKCSLMVEEAAESPTEGRSVNNSSLAVVKYVEPAVPSGNVNESNEPVSVSHKAAALTEVVESIDADNSCEETTRGVGLYHLSEEAGRKEPVGSSFHSLSNVDKDNTEGNGSSIELGSVGAVSAISQVMVSDCSETPAVLNIILSNDQTVSALELPGDNTDSSSREEVVKEDPDVLQNILGLPIPATVDFEIPILDVKFLSPENSPAKSPLEALLVGMPESRNEILCVREDNKRSSSEQTDLVVIEGGDSATCETFNNRFFLNNYDSCLPSDAEETKQDPYNCSNHDTFASLI